MHGSRLQGDVPGDGVVGRVRAIPEDVGEGRARGIHVQAVAEGSGHKSVAVESIVAGRGGSLPVGVVSDDDARLIVADLGVTEFLRQGEAEVPGAVLIGGGVLPGSGGADHVVAGHGSVG